MSFIHKNHQVFTQDLQMFPYLQPKKILLIEPPFYRFFHYERYHYPVTLTLVGSYLAKLGHDVLIYDADRPSPGCRALTRTEVRNNYHLYEESLNNENHPIWFEVRKTIERIRPEIVGLTSITAKIDSTNMVARIVKQLFGDKVKVILGGPHTQGMSVLYPNYDFGTYYDEIVTHIPNLVDQTPNKKLILDLDQYSPKNLSSILTSSGCPNSCTFCCHSFDKKVVYRNIPSIREELFEIKEKFGTTQIVYIMDDCFFSNDRHFNAVCNLLKELDLKFTAGSRIKSLTPQRIEKFMQSGGTRIYVGVESGSQKILDNVEKKLTVDEIIKHTKLLNDVNLPWSAFVIVGFPFETLEDLKLTEELLYTIRPTFVSINRFTPYPGTKIFQEYFRNTDIRFLDLFQLNSKSCVKLSDDIENYIDYLFRTFDDYNSKYINGS